MRKYLDHTIIIWYKFSYKRNMQEFFQEENTFTFCAMTLCLV